MAGKFPGHFAFRASLSLIAALKGEGLSPKRRGALPNVSTPPQEASAGLRSGRDVL